MNIPQLAARALTDMVDERLRHLKRKNAKVEKQVNVTKPDVYAQYTDGLITLAELFRYTIGYLPENEAAELIKQVDDCLVSVMAEVEPALLATFRQASLNKEAGAFMTLMRAIDILAMHP